MPSSNSRFEQPHLRQSLAMSGRRWLLEAPLACRNPRSLQGCQKLRTWRIVADPDIRLIFECCPVSRLHGHLKAAQEPTGPKFTRCRVFADSKNSRPLFTPSDGTLHDTQSSLRSHSLQKHEGERSPAAL